MSVAYSKIAGQGLGHEIVTKYNPLPVTLTAGAGEFGADAFGRFRMSTSDSLFDGKMLYDKQPEKFSERLTGTGTSTYNSNESTVTLAVGADADRVERASAWSMPYQPGSSQLIYITFNMLGHQADVTKIAGYLNDDDGLYLELRDGTAYITRRTSTSGSVVNDPVAQSSWSEDPLDGTGPSGITLDWDAVQLMAIDFSWLSAGRVRFHFFVGDRWISAHHFDAANSLLVPFMRMPNLRVKWDILATAAATASMKAICAAVEVENGHHTPGEQHSRVRDAVTAVSSNTPEQVLAVRLRADREHAFVHLTGLNVFATTNNDRYKWWIVKNPTYAGGSAASWVNDENGIIQYDETADGTWDGPATGSNNTVVASGLGASTGPVSLTADRVHAMAVELDGTPATYALVVEAIASGASMSGSLTWVQYA